MANHCTWLAKQEEKGTPSEVHRVRRQKPLGASCIASMTSVALGAWVVGGEGGDFERREAGVCRQKPSRASCAASIDLCCVRWVERKGRGRGGEETWGGRGRQETRVGTA